MIFMIHSKIMPPYVYFKSPVFNQSAGYQIITISAHNYNVNILINKLTTNTQTHTDTQNNYVSSSFSCWGVWRQERTRIDRALVLTKRRPSNNLINIYEFWGAAVNKCSHHVHAAANNLFM